ncbi:MAG TPA: helix-turn-helix transcriptional regulator [Alphaproteobacteria bacterium]|nr:helix-turn-helix transcriptional regulator [Alphaproteobacteria bacterium]USO06586.1 MAG: helix-turn-helix transcriptional regulator [Rhodospirillales bacterium]HOO82539.1 helix-turn-helix transcriptional regulator [Alphaproteobacteria bacterium]
MKYDLLHIQGQPYVLVPLHDYRSMVSGGKNKGLPDEILDALTAREESPVKIMRKHRGMTQKELAALAGISRPYLTEIETGKKDGSIRAMKALADVLGVSVGALA